MKEILKIVFLISFFKLISTSPKIDFNNIKSLATQCAKKEGGSEDDIDALINKFSTPTKEAKCVFACILGKV